MPAQHAVEEGASCCARAQWVKTSECLYRAAHGGSHFCQSCSATLKSNASLRLLNPTPMNACAPAGGNHEYSVTNGFVPTREQIGIQVVRRKRSKRSHLCRSLCASKNNEMNQRPSPRRAGHPVALGRWQRPCHSRRSALPCSLRQKLRRQAYLPIPAPSSRMLCAHRRSKCFVRADQLRMLEVIAIMSSARTCDLQLTSLEALCTQKPLELKVEHIHPDQPSEINRR